MDEKNQLANMELQLAKSRSLQLSKEQELLFDFDDNDQKSPSGFDRFFLMGYLSLSVLANAFLTLSMWGKQAGAFYAFNALCTGFGLGAVIKGSPLGVFLYTGYYTGSFLFASIVGMSAIIFLWSDDLCGQLAELGLMAIMSGEGSCAANEGLIRLIGTAIVLLEVGVEAFTLFQLKKLYCRLEQRDYVPVSKAALLV